MPERKSGVGRWVLGCFALMAGLALLCCCGGGIATMMAPAAMAQLLVEDAPLPGPTTAADPISVATSHEKACTELAATGETHLSPDDAARWILGEGQANVSVLRLSAQGDEASLAASVSAGDTPPHWFNLQTRFAFTMQNGWFTDLRFDQMIASGHDVSSLLAKTQLAQQANQGIANQRSQDPDLAGLLDSITQVQVADGMLDLTLKPGGIAMQQLCSDPSAPPASPMPPLP